MIVDRPTALKVANDGGLYLGDPSARIKTIYEFRSSQGGIQYELVPEGGLSVSVAFPPAAKTTKVWEQGWPGWMNPPAAAPGEAPQGLTGGSGLKLDDVYFLIGVAFSPALRKYADTGDALLELAHRIAAEGAYPGMAARCLELRKELAQKTA